jgi:hypothetical protein
MMLDLEDLKKSVESATGIATPDAEELERLVRNVKPSTFRFKDDGFIPNHPTWPLLLYPSCVRLPKSRDPAAIFESVFGQNGWGRSWRNGVYDFVHYHSKTHEVLAIARGKARLQFGGPKGRIFDVERNRTKAFCEPRARDKGIGGITRFREPSRPPFSTRAAL